MHAVRRERKRSHDGSVTILTMIFNELTRNWVPNQAFGTVTAAAMPSQLTRLPERGVQRAIARGPARLFPLPG